MSKFKAEEFLKDIGLELDIMMLNRDVATSDNIHQLPVANVDVEVAVMRVVDNLIGTYGQKIIMDVLLKVV